MNKLYGIVAALVVGVGIFFMTFFTVNQYERTVVTRFGKVVEVADPGLHFKVPLVNMIKDFRVDIQNLQPKEAANTYTIDNQEVDVRYNVFYRIPVNQVAFIYENVPDYEMRLLILANDRLKSEMGKINTAHIAEKRGELRDKIKAVLNEDAKELGVEVTDFQLTNIDYTKSYRAAVEASAAAKAGVETEENNRLQSIKRAENARETARGTADASLITATANAKSIQLKGEAEAAAIKAQAEALTTNKNLVELRKAERWDGKLPVQMLSGITPLMSFSAADGK